MSVIATRINNLGIKEITMYGLTFKDNTDDVRESPLLILAKDLLILENNVSIYDPLINKQTLRVEQAEIVKYVKDESCIAKAELLVIGKKGIKDFESQINRETVLFNLTDENLDDLSDKVINLY